MGAVARDCLRQGASARCRMNTGTVERARHRWREILPQLGIDTRFLANKHGPCPLCGGKDRYRFDDKDGSGSYYCSGCGPGVGVILLRKKHSWDFKTACDEIDKIIGRDLERQPTALPNRHNVYIAENDKAKALRRIERTLAEATDDRVVAAFLRKRRITVSSPALRGHPACPYYDNDDHHL